jgi:hypothetical protein
MQVQFVERENSPERLVSEAEIHFEEGRSAACGSSASACGGVRKASFT